MRRAALCSLSLMLLAVPASVGPEGAVHDDPLDRVAQALDQGRPLYARRLLRSIDATELASPEGSLLAARADAGRDAWRAVVERLATAAWLDSTAYGGGRVLLARARLETGDFNAAVDDYRAFLAYSPEREARALAEIGLGRALDGLGHGPEAAAAYGRAGAMIPELEPWCVLRAAESLARDGDTTAVRRLLGRAADTPLYRRTLIEIEAHEQAGDSAGALRLLLKAARSPAVTDSSASLRARAARILLAAGDTSAARETLRTAVRKQPGASREAAVLLAGLPGLGARDHLRLAIAFKKSGAPRSAAAEYRRYLDSRSLSPSERSSTQLEIGRLLYRGGAYYTAVRELQQLVLTEPGRSITAPAEYYMARATYRRGWRREGRARLREVADRYPGTAWAIRSLSLLGDLYESAGNPARARAVYQELADRYSNTSVARTARFRLGILAFQENDYATSRLHFDRLRRSGQRDDLHIAATYWAARARPADGDPRTAAEAQRLFREVQRRDPFGYYGFLAAERLGIDPWASLTRGPQPAPIDDELSRKFDLIDWLRRAGLDREANTIFASVMRSKPQRPEDIIGFSLALTRHGFGQQGVRMAWRAHSRLRGRWSTSVLRAIYPIAFQEIIRAESESASLEPYLLAAIARQESAFTPDVISRAGARGLLQIMPATGRWWAHRLGLRPYDTTLLLHPEINVHLGAAYFSDLSRRYGDLQLALVAYNAGPTRARSWRKRPEYGIDPELFVERVPFRETRNYLKGVQSQLRIYRALYGDLTPAPPAD